MQIKLMSWNVNGLRARLRNGFEDLCLSIGADVICLQETKLLRFELANEFPQGLSGYSCYLNPAQRRGYSGTAVYTKLTPVRIGFGFPKLGNDEGRIIVAEYEQFVLINVYTPNSKDDLSRLEERGEWDVEFTRVCASISKQKPVVVTGDLNVAHKPIDVHNPSNKKYCAGFTDQERASFDNLLKAGFLDTFRYVNGDIPNQYSYWSYFGNARANNVGWRLDYFLVSEELKDKIVDARIENHIGSSDHCPIILTLEV